MVGQECRRSVIVQGTMTKAQERHFWNDWLGFSLLGIIRGMLLCIVY